MTISRKRSDEIRQFILEHVESSSQTIAHITSEAFGISRQAANRHIKYLVESGKLTSRGNTRNRSYTLKPFVEKTHTIELTDGLEEHIIWRQYMQEDLREYASPHVFDICHYGFTEMFNNVVDHSQASLASVTFSITVSNIRMMILDDGIGIFKKLQDFFHLDDPRHAILELAKGKLTTDPQRHTGEGIFFASRIFDTFSIASNCISYLRFHEHDWLVERTEDTHTGTVVIMDISPQSQTQIEHIFEHYASSQDDYGFTRTRIPVDLARYGDEKLVSRSQAKRLLSRIDRFQEVFFDFNGVSSIGQAFADEIFRVFRREHPDIKLIWVNANQRIERMIKRAEQSS